MEERKAKDFDKAELQKLAACMRRAAAGEIITVGFLGGSITQGSVASTEKDCYAYLVYQWWCESFPQTKICYVNAGIGGTTSHFGAARVQEDLLAYRPDVVVVDFSVNDDGTDFFQETFEGTLRQIMASSSHPAVIVLNNVFYNTGVNAQKYHNRIARHYGVPCVSMKDTVFMRIQKGEYQREELTPDGLHPNDRGHRLVSEEIIRFLETAKSGMEQSRAEEGKAYGPLPAALTDNAYETARRLDNRCCKPELYGFYADCQARPATCGRMEMTGDFFRNGWIGEKKGDRMELTVAASNIAVQYRRTNRGKAPTARLLLDGNREEAVILDGTFDEDWGDCLYLTVLLHHGRYKEHHIEVEIVEEGEAVAPPFYLLSFIVA